MTKKQDFAARCALADLCGALQAYQQGDMDLHDWDAHKQTIEDLAEAYRLENEVPEDCK